MKQSELKHIFDYDPDAGVLKWKNPRSTRCKVGDIAGYHRVDGYVQIKLSGKTYLAHRLMWIYMYGEEVDCIDHINHNRSDNRACNLRLANKSQNGANRKKCKNNTTGYKGVCKKKTRYTAALISNGKRINMGYYDTPEKAYSAYQLGAYLYHGEFAFS